MPTSFADFDARVNGCVNHVRYADSWGLLPEQMLRRFVRAPEAYGVPSGEKSRGTVNRRSVSTGRQISVQRMGPRITPERRSRRHGSPGGWRCGGPRARRPER